MKLLGQGVEAAVAAQTDMFGRDAFAAGLLRLFSQSKDPLVVALDEKWGTGKTVFARRLITQAEESQHTVVYFDAFKRDYAPDVFIALSAALLEKLPKTKQTKSMRESAKAVVKTVGRLAFKGVIRAATAGAVSASDLDETVADVANDIGELDRLIDDRLGSAKKEEEAFAKFRKSLAALIQVPAAADSVHSEPKQIVFIIDELDRCRPDYALDVLETIKHFFSVAGVHFLLVCDFGQLVAAVKSRYGLATESETYLEKFIDVRVSFPTQRKSEHQNSVASFFRNLLKDKPDDGENGALWKTMSEFITKFSVRRGYSLRRIEKIVTQFALCMAFTDSKQFRHKVIVVVLCDLKISNRHLFYKSKNGTLTFKELENYYDFNEKEDSGIIRWLRYFYDAGINRNEEEWHSFASSLWKGNLDDDKDKAVYLANDVVDRISA
jgi:KAP family P-loop domain